MQELEEVTAATLATDKRMDLESDDDDDIEMQYIDVPDSFESISMSSRVKS